MKEAGLVIKADPYRTTIPRSQRGGEIIEPMISEQWFVTIEPLAKKALDAVKNGDIKIVPERFEKTYFNWMENIRDWCISRQLWWGHRIPVWYCPDGHMTVTREDPTECAQCGSQEIRQDEDVLDTWFSSGLWPFSTLGWPEETPDYKYFYPTSYMETGYDILFFWVARMIMSGLEYTGRIPFHTVYLHGLVRDEHGRKMSKTTGNVIDPLTVMDDLGTDALRFTLLVGSTPGNDTNVGLKKVESNRNFANKIWNIGRFVLSTLPDDFDQASYQYDPNGLSLADKWVFSRTHQVIADTTRFMENFEYGQAGSTVYDFLWSEFADWYIEYAKVVFAGDNEADKARTRAILVHVFDMVLRLLHPFVPFVTEAMWGYLPKLPTAPKALIVAKWPEPGPDPFEDSLVDFKLIQEIVRSIRNLRAEKGVVPSKRIAASFAAGAKADLLKEQSKAIASLAGLNEAELNIAESLSEKPDDASVLVVGSIEIYLPLAGMVDLAEEKTRLEKELKEAESHIERLEKLLGSDFANKAPAMVVQKEQDKLAGYKETAEKLKAQLK
jgi:valyl-tRNA synthetase